MRKLMTFQHLDEEKDLKVIFEITEQEGHWVAHLKYPGAEGEIKAPTFYGETAEQAERQLRKVFEKDYELAGEEALQDE